MQKKFRYGLLWSLIGMFAIADVATSDEASHKADSGQYLYTVSNSPSGNAVLGYRIEPSTGKLTQLPASPFATHGLGEGSFVLGDSDNGIVISKDRKFLFAPNRGSQTIAVFRIQSNGTLKDVPGSPFPTGGYTPVSLALYGDLLYVAHLGTGLPDICHNCEYRGFRVSKTGYLTPMENAVVKLSETPPAIPFALRFSPDGRFLIGTELGNSKINVFEVNRDTPQSDAQLIPVPGSPFDSIGKQPFGFSFNPVNASQLFISNVETLAIPQDVQSSISSYLIAKTGQIAPIVSQLPSNGGQLAACWVSLTDDGKVLFTTNAESDSISSYRVAVDGRLTLLHVTPIPHAINQTQNMAPVDMAITTRNKFLYLPTRDVPTITGFSIAGDGALTPIPGVNPLPIAISDAVPFGMAYVDFSTPSVEIKYRDE